jgi:hypothetical protein
VYGRDYDGKVLNFEASGGLLHYSLVMQDRETDSFWSIMTGDSLAGDLKGTPLVELSIGSKTRYGDWVREHPETRVLSVEGEEHIENNPYDNYFTSEKGFRGSVAADERLPTKTSIFAFQLDGKAYAVPFETFEGGRSFKAGKALVFLFRPADASLLESTLAFRSSGTGFVREDGVWKDLATGASFDPSEGGFDAAGATTLDGFDTFWFNWSMTHPRTKILKR